MGIYDYTVKNTFGKDVCLTDYKDHVILIINTACE